MTTRRSPSGTFSTTRDSRRPQSGTFSRRALANLLLSGPDPAALFDEAGRVVSINDAASEAGTPAPAEESRSLERCLPFWNDPEGLARLLENASRPGGVRNLGVTVPGKDGSPERYFWISTRECPNAGAGCFIAVARDVTDKTAEFERLKSLYNELAEHMSRDRLTGFLNRENFRFVLDREIAAADRSGSPLALVYVGLDRFKSLNDTHGLAAGDEYLRSLGVNLRGALPNP